MKRIIAWLKSLFRRQSEIEKYVKKLTPSEAILFFKKSTDKEYYITTKYPIPDENIQVLLNAIREDFPKWKTMNKEDFERTFEIASYNFIEKDYKKLHQIRENKLQLQEFKGKQFRIVG